MAEYWVTDQYFVGETIHVSEWSGAKFRGCEFLNCSIIGPGYLWVEGIDTTEFAAETKAVTEQGVELLPTIGLYGGNGVIMGSHLQRLTWHPDFMNPLIL